MTSQISGPCCDSDIKPDQYKSLMKALLRQTHCMCHLCCWHFLCFYFSSSLFAYVFSYWCVLRKSKLLEKTSETVLGNWKEIIITVTMILRINFMVDFFLYILCKHVLPWVIWNWGLNVNIFSFTHQVTVFITSKYDIITGSVLMLVLS